jgi:hypothetical protein
MTEKNSTDLVQNIELIYKRLANNINYLKTTVSYQSSDRVEEKILVERVLFYNLSLMDSIGKLFEVDDKENLEWVQNLFDFVDMNEWMRSPTLAIRNLADEELVLSAANALITIKLMTRLAFYNNQTHRFGFNKTNVKDLSIKQDSFDLIKVVFK